MGRFIDITGCKYNRLTVIKRVGSDRGRNAIWLCKCDCGNEITARGTRLRNGVTRSCGCLKGELISEASVTDLTGQKFGRLTIVKRHGSTGGRLATWLCKCDCGNKLVVIGGNLHSGGTKSCGCLQRERTSETHSLPNGVASFNAMVSSMKAGAKKRGYEWHLADEQVRHLTEQPCHYCGMPPLQVSHPTECNGAYIHNGLDRVDNKKGYVIDNVVPCCKQCNRAKNTLTVDSFRSWICQAYKHAVSGVAAQPGTKVIGV